jgi:hypothetical protein
MSHDPLSDVLRSVRLRGAVYYYVSFDGEWAAETPPSEQLAGALMPGADHVLAYHLMARGEGWPPPMASHQCAWHAATS